MTAKLKLKALDPKREYEKKVQMEMTISDINKMFGIDEPTSEQIIRHPSMPNVAFTPDEWKQMQGQIEHAVEDQPVLELSDDEIQVEIDYLFHHKPRPKKEWKA